MTMLNHPERNKNLRYINNLEDLQEEIRKTKIRLKAQEQNLEERWNRLPQETIKATAGSVIPFFLNNSVASKTWNVLKSISGLVFNTSSKNKDDIKENLYSRAKQLGLFAALRVIYGIWNRNKV